jgi:hypothetical protein
LFILGGGLIRAVKTRNQAKAKLTKLNPEEVLKMRLFFLAWGFGGGR